MGCGFDSVEVENYKVVKEISKDKTDIYRSFLLRSPTNVSEYVYKSVNVIALNKEEKDSILNEINVLKKIQHPNVIEIKNEYYSEDNKYLNIITEYAEEGTLQEKYEEQRKKKEYFEENELLDWFIQILLALKCIHEKKILHRDIRPSNIFLMKDMAKLGNFGVAKSLNPTINYAKTMVTKPHYLAPEVKQSKIYTYEADIWALGVTFYQLIILDYPFEGSSIKEIQDNIAKGNKKPIPKECKIDEKFIKIINSMMSNNPRERISLKNILEESIIKSRIECYLMQQKFTELNAKKTIREYEKEERKKKKTVPIVLERIEEKEEQKDNETIEQKEKVIQERKEWKEKKAKYDLFRHMSTLNQIVHFKDI
jgi:NIMA (never in mitosis gene a)-related kinase